ncbi:MAG TPA: GyrI-like domain-containing protein, partial [Candidatus Limnocylindrales bacterium]|nr:GyrI-like domain-containing protein [Candidatus Limnocylindrales bacterium]
QWSLLIELPATATDDEVEAAIDDGRRRHPEAALDRLREVWFEEGEVVEALHVGPYATEPETIARMTAVAEAAGRTPMGPHHEIYLGDPRRAAPERLRTVLRQPVCPDQAQTSKAQPREDRPQ